MKRFSDKELMKIFQDESIEAFEELYSRYKEKIYAYIKKRIKKEEDVEEIFQKTFLKLYEAKSSYKDKYEVSSWLYTISRNTLIDMQRKKKEVLVENYDDFDIESEPKVSDIKEELMTNGLAELNDKDKKIIEMRFYSEKSFKEMANALKTSEVNARKLVSRAVAKLKVIMEKKHE